MRQVVVMPGGFHPFHAGHASLYQSAIKAFPDAEVYVAATNDTKIRPFPFKIKEKLAKVAGVAPGHFVQVKSPFKAEEITRKYNPNEDVLIFVRSEKDKNEQPKPGGMKKDGTSAYFQPWTGKDLQPFSQHAYMAYLPTIEFGPGITSATEIRNAWPTLNDKRKTAMVMSLYPVTQKNPKLAANVVKMLDMGMGNELAEEFRPSTSQAMNIQKQTRQKMNPGTNRFVWKRPNQIGGSYTENELKSLNFKYSAKYNMWGGTQQMWDELTGKITENKNLSVEQLAHISDKALDDAYHYGRSTPGANFGWMANIQSAKAAKRLIDAGVTDIEAISDAIHKGWNVTAAADYKGQLQLDTPTPDEKKLKRAKLAMQSYSQLPEEEKEKDRVVARALLQAIKGNEVTEGLGIPYPTTYEQENNKFKRRGPMRITNMTEFAPPSSDRGDSGDSRSRRIRKLLEIAIQVAKEKNIDELGMIHGMNMIAGDDFFNTAVEGILPDITDKEYMFVLQSAYKTVKQGLAEAKKKRKKKSKNRSLGRYFFPGYSYYGGGGESGEGGGEGGGGESKHVTEQDLTPNTIHKLADRKGIKWDNEPNFLKLTKRLTGKEHLDDLNQSELQKIKKYLEKQGVAEGSENLSYIGNCTDDDVIEYIFGDATNFAQAVEEHGDEFTIDDLVVKYDPESDVHSFYYKKQGVAEGEEITEGPFVQRITNPKKVSIYLKIGKGSKLVATDIPYEILDKYITKVIQKYPQFKPTDFSFKSSDKVDENLGIPYPTTYEQENNKFKRRGPMRITDLTEMDEDYLNEK